MGLRIGDIAPDFTQESSEGKINFYDWAGDNWVVLFSHPADFTPVCTTELGATAKLKDEFAKRNAKVLAVSVDRGDAERVRRFQEDADCPLFLISLQAGGLGLNALAVATERGVRTIAIDGVDLLERPDAAKAALRRVREEAAAGAGGVRGSRRHAAGGPGDGAGGPPNEGPASGDDRAGPGAAGTIRCN